MPKLSEHQIADTEGMLCMEIKRCMTKQSHRRDAVYGDQTLHD